MIADPTLPVPDLPLLRKAVAWVEEQDARPERESEWFQAAWRSFGVDVDRDCGTAYCVAGYVCEVSGEQWRTDVSDWLTTGEHTSRGAARLLGITVEEATWLFDTDNTAAQVRHEAERIAARAGERL